MFAPLENALAPFFDDDLYVGRRLLTLAAIVLVVVYLVRR